MSATFRSHFLTIAPSLRGQLFPVRTPPHRPWRTELQDPELGTVAIGGKLTELPDSDKLVVVVHGLSGSADSYYSLRAARIGAESGYSTLRLGLRGTDLSGEDVYHAGLTADLHAALRAPDIANRFGEICVLGFSLGGHMALCAAAEELPDTVRKIAAICPPLDLQPGQQHVDRTGVYRRQLVRSLRMIQRAVARRGRGPDVDLRGIRTLWEWDEQVICRRFGFRDPRDYYETASVRSNYRDTRVPILIVGSRHDPLVPFHTVEDYLVDSELVTVRYFDNEGHVYFSKQADIGFASRGDMERQVFAWFDAG